VYITYQVSSSTEEGRATVYSEMVRMADDVAGKTEFLSTFRSKFQEAAVATGFEGTLPTDLDFSLAVTPLSGHGITRRKKGCCELTRVWTIVLSVAVAFVAAVSIFFGLHRFIRAKKRRQGSGGGSSGADNEASDARANQQAEKKQKKKKRKKGEEDRDAGSREYGDAPAAAAAGGASAGGHDVALAQVVPPSHGQATNPAPGLKRRQQRPGVVGSSGLSEEVMSMDVTRVELIDFLQVHDPAKVGNADLVLRLYENRHTELRRALEQKYGAPITKKEEHSAVSSVPISTGDLAGALDRVDLELEKPPLEKPPVGGGSEQTIVSTEAHTAILHAATLGGGLGTGSGTVPPGGMDSGGNGWQQQQQQQQLQQLQCMFCGNSQAPTRLDADSNAYCESCWDAYYGAGSFVDMGADRSDTLSVVSVATSATSSVAGQSPRYQPRFDRSPSPEGYLV
jgi:hypothetical protein